MKQIISFEKDIVFNGDVAVINSISLEHKERVIDCEVEGEFCVFGNYKAHTDTTELENFKFDLPFSTLLPDDVVLSSVEIDIDNFVYDLTDNNVLHVVIDFLLQYDVKEVVELDKFVEENNLFAEDRDIELNLVNDSFNDNVINTEFNVDNNSNDDVIETVENEYIIYHIYIVQESDTLDSIIKKYDITLDYLKEYNDISEIKVGTKLIIPDIINE